MEKYYRCDLNITLPEICNKSLQGAIITELNSSGYIKVEGRGFSATSSNFRDLPKLLPLLTPLSQDLEDIDQMNKALKDGIKYELYMPSTNTWMLDDNGNPWNDGDLEDLYRWRRVKIKYKYYRPYRTVEEAEHLLGREIEYKHNNKRAVAIINNICTATCVEGLFLGGIDETSEVVLRKTKDYTPIGVEITEKEYLKDTTNNIKVEVKEK